MSYRNSRLSRFLTLTLSLLVVSAVAGLFYYLKAQTQESYQNNFYFRQLASFDMHIRELVGHNDSSNSVLGSKHKSQLEQKKRELKEIDAEIGKLSNTDNLNQKHAEAELKKRLNEAKKNYQKSYQLIDAWFTRNQHDTLFTSAHKFYQQRLQVLQGSYAKGEQEKKLKQGQDVDNINENKAIDVIVNIKGNAKAFCQILIENQALNNIGTTCEKFADAYSRLKEQLPPKNPTNEAYTSWPEDKKNSFVNKLEIIQIQWQRQSEQLKQDVADTDQKLTQYQKFSEAQQALRQQFIDVADKLIAKPDTVPQSKVNIDFPGALEQTCKHIGELKVLHSSKLNTVIGSTDNSHLITTPLLSLYPAVVTELKKNTCKELSWLEGQNWYSDEWLDAEIKATRVRWQQAEAFQFGFGYIPFSLNRISSRSIDELYSYSRSVDELQTIEKQLDKNLQEKKLVNLLNEEKAQVEADIFAINQQLSKVHYFCPKTVTSNTVNSNVIACAASYRNTEFSDLLIIDNSGNVQFSYAINKATSSSGNSTLWTKAPHGIAPSLLTHLNLTELLLANHSQTATATEQLRLRLSKQDDAILLGTNPKKFSKVYGVSSFKDVVINGTDYRVFIRPYKQAQSLRNNQENEASDNNDVTDDKDPSRANQEQDSNNRSSSEPDSNDKRATGGVKQEQSSNKTTSPKLDGNSNHSQLFLVGLVAKNKLLSSSMSLSSGVAWKIISALLIVIAIFSLIKPLLVRPDHGYSSMDMAMIVAGLIFFIATVSIAITFLKIEADERESRREELQQNAKALKTQFKDELSAKLERYLKLYPVIKVDKLAGHGNWFEEAYGCSSMDSKTRVIRFPSDKGLLPPFENISSIGLGKVRSEEKKAVNYRRGQVQNLVLAGSKGQAKQLCNTRPNLAYRQYFKDAENGLLYQHRLAEQLRLYGSTPNSANSNNNNEAYASFAIERIRNIATHELTTQLVIPNKSIQQQDENSQLIDDSELMATIGIEFYSLRSPVLSAHTQFAVIENKTGKVLFHSQPNRGLVENFYQESEHSKRLLKFITRTSLLSDQDNTELFTPMHYNNKNVSAIVRPLHNSIPWTLVVWQDVEFKDSSRLWLLTSIVLLFLLALLVFGLFVLLTWRISRFNWRLLWYQHYTYRYAILIAVNGLLVYGPWLHDWLLAPSILELLMVMPAIALVNLAILAIAAKLTGAGITISSAGSPLVAKFKRVAYSLWLASFLLALTLPITHLIIKQSHQFHHHILEQHKQVLVNQSIGKQKQAFFSYVKANIDSDLSMHEFDTERWQQYQEGDNHIVNVFNENANVANTAVPEPPQFELSPFQQKWLVFYRHYIPDTSTWAAVVNSVANTTDKDAKYNLVIESQGKHSIPVLALILSLVASIAFLVFVHSILARIFGMGMSDSLRNIESSKKNSINRSITEVLARVYDDKPCYAQLLRFGQQDLHYIVSQLATGDGSDLDSFDFKHWQILVRTQQTTNNQYFVNQQLPEDNDRILILSANDCFQDRIEIDELVTSNPQGSHQHIDLESRKYEAFEEWITRKPSKSTIRTLILTDINSVAFDLEKKPSVTRPSRKRDENAQA